jgi:hypothetical protein
MYLGDHVEKLPPGVSINVGHFLVVVPHKVKLVRLVGEHEGTQAGERDRGIISAKPYPATRHIGRIKLNASHGVLYGMIEYAANSPNAHNAVNIANRFFPRSIVTRTPSAERIKIGASTFMPHFI